MEAVLEARFGASSRVALSEAGRLRSLTNDQSALMLPLGLSPEATARSLVASLAQAIG